MSNDGRRALDIEQIVRDSYDGEAAPEPPMFDASKFAPSAECIIERLRKKKHLARGDKYKPADGLDLTQFRDDLAQLLADVRELYVIEMGEFKERNDPVLQLTEWWKPAAPSADADVWWNSEDVQEIPVEDTWLHYYKRRRGRPSAQTNGLPIKPLHPVYECLRAWWQRHDLGKFSPDDEIVDDDEALFNPPMRFLLAVIQTLDSRYTAANARGLVSTVGKPRSRRKSKK